MYLYMKGFSLGVFGNWALRINSRLGYDFDFKSYILEAISDSGDNKHVIAPAGISLRRRTPEEAL